jgi:HrpA-like RNA helicase
MPSDKVTIECNAEDEVRVWEVWINDRIEALEKMDREWLVNEANVRAAHERIAALERQLNNPMPPYPYFWRTQIQRVKTRLHKLTNEVHRTILPNLRLWKQRYKSTKGSLMQRIKELERENEALRTPACQNCACDCHLEDA